MIAAHPGLRALTNVFHIPASVTSVISSGMTSASSCSASPACSAVAACVLTGMIHTAQE